MINPEAIDANDGIIPNRKKIDEMIKKDCEYEASKAIRNERSLVYVASTRAKNKLIVQYGKQLSYIFTPGVQDSYSYLDLTYNSYKHEALDLDSFAHFCEVYVNDKLE